MLRVSLQDNTLAKLLPAGKRLVARLEAPVSSAVPAPVIAVVEYNYEHNGEIVLPAGAKVFGKLSHVTPSGLVGFQFDRVETPDGGVEKIDATAVDLKFGPLKGNVSGRNRGRNFLVRSVTGIGTLAAYVVGGQGTTGFNGPISENSLLRERLADNIAMAGQDESINLYKQLISRSYLNRDDDGNCYIAGKPGCYVAADFNGELAKLEDCLRGPQATLETPYDESFIARKREVLRQRGIPLLTIQA